MTQNRRIALNIIATYGRSRYMLVNGLDVDDGVERGRLRIDGGTEASKVEMMSGRHYDEKNAWIGEDPKSPH